LSLSPKLLLALEVPALILAANILIQSLRNLADQSSVGSRAKAQNHGDTELDARYNPSPPK
jgi:hypothetical protein